MSCPDQTGEGRVQASVFGPARVGCRRNEGGPGRRRVPG
ncbi:hypothetical protein CSE45_2117 [Citreicella sp. SE45]|nr:hypothetical protein CSE45_2117 [Citreicella sp. SE45]